MGKGNRTQNERAESVLAAAGAQTKKKKAPMPTWVGTLIVVSVLVLLILFATFCILRSQGVFARGKIIARTENYKVSVPMMSYMVYTEYQNWVQNYKNTGYMQYIKGSGGDALNTSKPLRSQNYSVVTDEKTGTTTTTTWFTYFAKQAATDVEQILRMCELARARGVELSADELAEIDTSIQLMALYAKAYGYTTSAYIASMYGQGVNAKDVRKMMELSTLAGKYADMINDELKAAITENRVNEAYEADKKTYDIAIDYLGYAFSATFKAEGATEETLQKYKDLQAKYKGWVENLKTIEDPDTLFTTLTGYVEEYSRDLKKESDVADMVAEIQKINYEKPDSSDEHDDWLFNKETPRATGEFTTFTDEKAGWDEADEKYVGATSTYSYYRVLRAVHRNDGAVRSVGHILFKSKTYDGLTTAEKLSGTPKILAQRILDRGEAVTAKAMGHELIAYLKEEGKLTEHKDGEATYYTIQKDVFEEFGAMTEDSNIFYEDVKKGDMVKSFEAWLFSDKRHENEISYPDAVESTHGAHVMFYTGNERQAWYAAVETDVLKKDSEKWYENAKSAVDVTFKDYWDKIS